MPPRRRRGLLSGRSSKRLSRAREDSTHQEIPNVKDAELVAEAALNELVQEPQPPEALGPTQANDQVDRPYVGRVSVDLKFIKTGVTHCCTQIIKDNFAGRWRSWRDAPIANKDNMFAAFSRIYYWHKEDESQVRLAWNKAMGKQFTELFCDLRANILAMKKTKDFKECLDIKFDWIQPDHWQGLIEYWSSDGFKRKSEAGKKNRQTLKDGAICTHTGGSISFAAHEERLEKELKRKPTPLELYLKTHKKKNTDKFCDNRSAAVIARYEEFLRKKYGNGNKSSKSPNFDPASWLHASGSSGARRNYVYGLGGETSSQFGRATVSTKRPLHTHHEQTASSSARGVYITREEVDAVVSASVKEHVSAIVKEQIATAFAELIDRTVERLKAELHRPTTVPSSSIASPPPLSSSSVPHQYSTPSPQPSAADPSPAQLTSHPQQEPDPAPAPVSMPQPSPSPNSGIAKSFRQRIRRYTDGYSVPAVYQRLNADGVPTTKKRRV